MQQIDVSDLHGFLTVKEGLDESSIRQCMGRVGVFNQWLSDNNKDINPESIEQFFIDLKAKGLKNNTLNTYHFMFRHLVFYYKDRGLPNDFFDGFKSFKKTKPDIIIFTQEEIEKILNTSLTYGKFHGKNCDYLDFRYRTMTMFLAYTGCRYSEAAELTVKHLDISAGKATFINTKTNENRTAYFTEPLRSDLKTLIENRQPNDRVFCNSSNKLIQLTEYSEDLKRRARVAGVTKRVFPHNFRHSYITHMLEVGVPITEVASLVGHKDIQTTFSTYMHLADKTLQNAAMLHPMVRKNVDPKVILRMIKETLEAYHLENDNRFTYKLAQLEKGLNITVKSIL